MKNQYIQPSITIVALETVTIVAASGNVNITVRNTEYNGEGRAKQDNGWSDIWEDDWSKE